MHVADSYLVPPPRWKHSMFCMTLPLTLAQSWDVRTLLAVGRAIAPTDAWYQQWLAIRDGDGNTALHLAVQVRTDVCSLGSFVTAGVILGSLGDGS